MTTDQIIYLSLALSILNILINVWIWISRL